MLIGELWPWIATAVVTTVSLGASVHAVLNRRDSRAAALWIGLIWFMPLVGPLLYSLLGINRIRRYARGIRGRLERRRLAAAAGDVDASPALAADFGHLRSLVRVVDGVTARRLVAGNQIDVLVNGDRAYPAMLAAIGGATRTIELSSYIFDDDAVGRQFVDALGAAVARGVDVRVLVDDFGVRYTYPPVTRALRAAGVKAATFMPVLSLRRVSFLNLRSHRKLLIVDGREGFTGGMNIRAAHVIAEAASGQGIRDVQVRLRGPVVGHLRAVFGEDWSFTTGEELTPLPPPLPIPGASVLARGISDGPDEDMDNLRFTLLGALSAARQRVAVVTPYFLPDRALVAALNVAAMRGVRVDIVLPSKGNLPPVQWASTAQLWQVLEHGCRVWLTPPPFDHAKVVVVDDLWSLVGSTNWDPRALRLNFEFNVECYDQPLALELLHLIDQRIAEARPLDLATVDGRSLPIRLRDGCARLLTPYL